MKKVLIKNVSSERLSGFLHEVRNPKGLFILCHGFRGNKNYPLLTKLCKDLNEEGYDCFRFDFSGNGESEGLFGHAGLIKERSDLLSVIKHFKKYENVFLFGHSMGGAVCIITAGSVKRVKGVVVLNSLVLPTISFKDSSLEYNPSVLFAKKEEEAYNPRVITKNFVEKALVNFNEFVNNNVLHKSFFEQAKTDVTDYAEKLKKPLLIIHSKKDELIPLSHAEYLHNQNPENSRLVIINSRHIPVLPLPLNRIFKEIKKWLSEVMD
ncbi:MAG: alpha/beta hydrolase [Nanoarchaeota archaeon]|nr:alpha/beta hydrolase [Nanoarchaeota archaeon]